MAAAPDMSGDGACSFTDVRIAEKDLPLSLVPEWGRRSRSKNGKAAEFVVGDGTAGLAVGKEYADGEEAEDDGFAEACSPSFLRLL